MEGIELQSVARGEGSPDGRLASRHPRMRISGDLEDARVSEVMQLIHFGGRSGTLSVESGARRAEIGFHKGKILHAWSTETSRLGKILVERGLVTAEQVADAMARRREMDRTRSLGRELVDRGLVSSTDLRKAVEEQIQRVVLEAVGWAAGSFLFDVEQLKPVPELGRYPGDIIPEVHLDTQKLLLEATRRLDEARRSANGADDTAPVEVMSGRAPAPSRQRPGPGQPRDGSHDPAAGLAPLPQDATGQAPSPDPLRVQIVTDDAHLLDGLSALAEDPSLRLLPIELRDAGNSLPGERPPLVILDLSTGCTPEDVASIDRLRPRSPILAVASDPDTTLAAFTAGAMAVVPATAEAIYACARRIAAQRFVAESSEPTEGIERLVIGRLRRVLGDIRSGVFSATMTLSLMSLVSESAERAVLLLVKPTELFVLGAFGFAQDSERPLAELTRGLSFPRSETPELEEVLAEGRIRGFEVAEALPPDVIRLVGRPRTGRGILIPVIGRDTPIALIYADNGGLDADIQNLDLMEVATAQVGFALENESLRRLLETGRHAK